MPLGLMLAHQRLKFEARKQLEQLREDAAYSGHGGTSAVEICRFGKNHITSTYRASASFQKPKLDKPKFTSLNVGVKAPVDKIHPLPTASVHRGRHLKCGRKAENDS
jgi:hypothetical protein